MLASEDGLTSAIGGDSWPTSSVDLAPGQLRERAPEPEQGKGAAAGGRLLSAEEVHVELAAELRRRRTPAPGRSR